MLKVYRSTSVIAFNVMINGTRRHVSFDPVSTGGSIFSTNDEKLQGAIEKTSMFGTMFKLDSKVECKSLGGVRGSKGGCGQVGVTAEEAYQAWLDEGNNGTMEDYLAQLEQRNSVVEIPEGFTANDEITNCADAKALLLTLGVPAANLKNKAAILAEAQNQKIIFTNWK